MEQDILSRRELEHIIRTRKLPNAFVFSGEPHTGRLDAAFWLAKGCNCLAGQFTDACQCRSCKKISLKTHPDILLVDLQDQKKNISISQVRQTALALASRPNEARHRVVIICNSHLMTVQTQNALLKMLEEPPESTFFILICDKPSLLLSTILSRCRKIRFSSLSEAQAREHLTSNYRMSSDEAAIMVGTLGPDVQHVASQFSAPDKPELTAWTILRRWLLKNFSGIMTAVPPKGMQTALMLSQEICRDTARLPVILAVIRSFFRDLIVYRHAPQKITNLDFSDRIAEFSQTCSPENCFGWLKSLYECEYRLASNCTPRLILDSFFLQMVSQKERRPL